MCTLSLLRFVVVHGKLIRARLSNLTEFGIHLTHRNVINVFRMMVKPSLPLINFIPISQQKLKKKLN